MDRRTLLKGLGALGMAGAALPQAAFAATKTVTGLPFAEPTALTAVNGVLNFSTSVEYGRNKLYGNKVRLRGFDGQLTGKTLRVKAGERLHFNMLNVLPKGTGTTKSTVEKEAGTTTVAAMQSGHVHSNAAFNTTNLHVHGLHVSPKQPSDYVLMKIEPGDYFQYKYEIPADHPPGTYFYHPHYHGAVGVQVGSGMAGALIIEGEIDHIPEIAQAAEKIMVLQTLAFDSKGELESNDKLGGFPFTVNGLLSPVLSMRPGEVQRWRMVNASIEDSITLALSPLDSNAKQPITVLCLDGNPLTKAIPVTDLALASGNRADVLVKAPAKAGTYELRYLKTAKDGTQQTQIVLTVRVAGPAKDMPLFSGPLPSVPILKPIAESEITNKRTLVYGYDGNLFTVNGVTFGADQPQQNVTLGAVEEWTVTDTTGFPHSFHIHVNPFQVVSSPAQQVIEAGQWMDTLEVPRNGSITFRTRFVDFDGTFVLHCHYLPHEDGGLMQIVNVNKSVVAK
ncbi:MAG: multicopper oxidase domain-containing protein [Rhodospirillaceae bacterium]|nr:multicopper oxidase domain-containing protein [Rhodospirillales bacterium]